MHYYAYIFVDEGSWSREYCWASGEMRWP